mmetsp:Transcript_10854/g.38363  ORF Transcript_10854/g.38363 Transcript_10854/m.38363 type:complete len:251 (-) Transcript_10854:109-861(-)
MLPRLAFATGAATAASALAKAALEFRGRPESDVAPPEQLLRVQRAPAFLTPDDIKAVHALRRQHLAANAPHASEVQGEHGTYYLQAAGLARAVAPELLDKLTNLAFQADASHFGGNAASAKIRCVEFHEYGPGAQLQKQTHFDLGSSVTVDCMLSEDGDYEGGNFETLEADGSLLRHTFKQGDVLIFPSLKYHCVSPITSGFRRVMVIELWQGPENECNHRCDDASNSVCANPLDAVFLRLDDHATNFWT